MTTQSKGFHALDTLKKPAIKLPGRHFCYRKKSFFLNGYMSTFGGFFRSISLGTALEKKTFHTNQSVKVLNYKHVRVSVIIHINIIFKETVDISIITLCKLNLIYNYNLSDIPFQLMMLPR